MLEQKRLKSQQEIVALMCKIKEKEVLLDLQTKKIDQMDIEIQEKIEQRCKLRIFLRDNYVDLLRNDFDNIDCPSYQSMKRKEYISPVYIVNNLNLLKEKVDKDIFPGFMDEESIEFVLKMADIENELDALRKREKNIAMDSNLEQKIEALKIDFKENQSKLSVNEIQKRLREVSQQNNENTEEKFMHYEESKIKHVQFLFYFFFSH